MALVFENARVYPYNLVHAKVNLLVARPNYTTEVNLVVCLHLAGWHYATYYVLDKKQKPLSSTASRPVLGGTYNHIIPLA